MYLSDNGVHEIFLHRISSSCISVMKANANKNIKQVCILKTDYMNWFRQKGKKRGLREGGVWVCVWEKRIGKRQPKMGYRAPSSCFGPFLQRNFSSWVYVCLSVSCKAVSLLLCLILHIPQQSWVLQTTHCMSTQLIKPFQKVFNEKSSHQRLQFWVKLFLVLIAFPAGSFSASYGPLAVIPDAGL